VFVCDVFDCFVEELVIDVVLVDVLFVVVVSDDMVVFGVFVVVDVGYVLIVMFIV